MISGLCGFAELIRRSGGEVGAAELIDAARACTLIDLADPGAVEQSLRMSLSWATVQPDAFGELFAAWFGGGAGDGEEGLDPEETTTVSLDADTVDAARIHTEEATATRIAEMTPTVRRPKTGFEVRPPPQQNRRPKEECPSACMARPLRLRRERKPKSSPGAMSRSSSPFPMRRLTPNSNSPGKRSSARWNNDGMDQRSRLRPIG